MATAKPPKLTDLNIIEATQRRDLFEPWFRKRFFQAEATWGPWFSFLKVLFGLDVTEADLELFRQCTGRTDVPDGGFTEAWLICGRRAGKSFVISLVAVFLATFIDWRPYLQHGERGTIAILAKDRQQSQTIFRHITALIERVKVLRPLITRKTNELIELANGINIEIATASYQTIRGRTVIAGLLDEMAFWNSEGSNPDSAILSALRPSMGTVPGSVLLCASSPYARKGALYDHHAKHYGKDGSDVLLWQSPTRTMNPTFKQSIIDDAMEKDEADARAEYLAEFRNDLQSYVDQAVIDSLIVAGRHELAPMAGVDYHGFVDPAGGSGSDSMTMAIAHKEGSNVVIDCVREVKPGFSPQAVVEQFVAVFQSYRITQIYGDNWGGLFVREPFAPLEYIKSKPTKNEIYAAALALLNSRQVQLLDHKVLRSQICNLERRTGSGSDRFDHPKGQNDDVANAALGAVLLANDTDRGVVHYHFTSVPGFGAGRIETNKSSLGGV